LFYEEANILFNAAAVCSQLGAGELRDNNNSLISAAKHFQTAAGILTYVKEKVCTNITEKIPKDLSNESLDALILLNLAHAQECTYEKAVLGSMKDSILSILAMEASAMYETVASSISTSDVLDKVKEKK
jgi:programmed cell death 6-interacting protein